MSTDRHLVVGLGNPGEKYHFTRHNIAWLVLDAFADRVNWRGGGKRRDAAMVHAGRVLGLDLVMAKPETFMNESGIAVRKLLAAERVPLTALLVVVDDFSLPFGTLRFREGGSAGGHNGLTSINNELGTDRYPRLRIGIGDPRQSGTAEQHVLGGFTAAERLRLPEVEVAAGEVGPQGVRVNAVCPGITNTPLLQMEIDTSPDPAATQKAYDAWAPIGRSADPLEQARGDERGEHREQHEHADGAGLDQGGELLVRGRGGEDERAEQRGAEAGALIGGGGERDLHVAIAVGLA